MPLSLMRSAAPESFLVGIMSQILEFDNGPHSRKLFSLPISRFNSL